MKIKELTPVCTDEQAELTRKLMEASKAYYNGDTPLMSDAEFDQKLDELKGMEFMNEFMYEGSPTTNVGAPTVVRGLKKVKHEYPTLSLDKVKYVDRENLIKWFGNESPIPYGGHAAVMSWKMDGSTIVLSYDKGVLTSAVTRGDGFTGSDITHNARFIKGIPEKINAMGHVVVRGEAYMEYAEFERINAEGDGDTYENPRNLATATIQMLDANESKKREIHFKAFELVTPDVDTYIGDDTRSSLDIDFNLRFMADRLEWLKTLGFDVVEFTRVSASDYLAKIEGFKKALSSLPYPTDGLVFSYNDLKMGWGLGTTGHHPKWAIALKWTDEQVETTLRDIEWSPSRTGLLNPVAVFDPVRLEGTTVSRASLHNVSYIYDKDLRIGDRITVYKANMIIPQVGENLSGNSRNAAVKISTMYKVPERCPVCGEPTSRSCEAPYVLKCLNPDCNAKKIGRFVHFCSRDGLNIEGMSEETIKKFVDLGIINGYSDFFMLDDVKEKIENLEGFGPKSYENIKNAVEKARTTSFVPLITALGIEGLGKGQAKLIAKYIEESLPQYEGEYVWDAFVELISEGFDFSAIKGIGGVLAYAIKDWADTWYHRDAGKRQDISFLIDALIFTDRIEAHEAKALDGLTFVITGSLNHYDNREALVAEIEAKGGKVSGSVSNKTTCLINNDTASTSGKNKKAKELGVEIISEDEFIKRFLEE